MSTRQSLKRRRFTTRDQLVDLACFRRGADLLRDIHVISDCAADFDGWLGEVAV